MMQQKTLTIQVVRVFYFWRESMRIELTSLCSRIATTALKAGTGTSSVTSPRKRTSADRMSSLTSCRNARFIIREHSWIGNGNLRPCTACPLLISMFFIRFLSFSA